jgi:hypothetical protein
VGLLEKIIRIGAANGIKTDDLVIEEAEYFMTRHIGHGNYNIEISYDPQSDRVDCIYLTCSADNLPNPINCEHLDPSVRGEFRFSIIYSRRQISELDIQAKRRAGIIPGE